MRGPILVAALHAAVVLSDGTGLIGLGKTLYHPTCAFTCRIIVKGCILSCTPEEPAENHGTHHNPVATPPECFVGDESFLKTVALCIDTYCPLTDRPSLALLEDYWASHLGTGTLGDYQYVPAMSYPDALAAARGDERRVNGNATTSEDHQDHEGHGDHNHHSRAKKRQFMTPAGPEVTSELPVVVVGEPLNTTSFVAPADWQVQYNGLLDFETNESRHSYYTVAIFLVAIALPALLSLPRLVPSVVRSHAWSDLQSALINPPAVGRRHREPAAGLVGIVPTRGQALYIFAISFLNIMFLLGPYVNHHPQSIFSTRDAQTLSIIGNRAGSLAMGNAAALFLFAARNNVLLWATDWSYSTYLLLHRWLGYWCVLHTVLHSLMLWQYYATYGDYAAELVREYWIWGIVGTVAVVAIFPSSLLIVRQKLYEGFLASHVLLALFFLLGYYHHMWYLYKYDWGYEIWMYVAAGIWAADRVVRLVRTIVRGYRTAAVSLAPGTDGEYIRIDIEGINLSEGVAYLSFPMLGWRLWESHPFSVAFNSKDVSEGDASSASNGELSEGKEVQVATRPMSAPMTTFFARARTGMTGRLAARAASELVRVRVVVEGPYPHSGHVVAQLKQTSNVVYIAGGVGITAILSYARHVAVPSSIFWGTRKGGLVESLQPALAALRTGSVEVETVVGQRLNLDAILYKALVVRDGCHEGLVGIVVCGPPAMSDQVRRKVTQLTRNGPPTKPYVLLDEAYGW